MRPMNAHTHLLMQPRQDTADATNDVLGGQP
jgi:hypothetical protein